MNEKKVSYSDVKAMLDRCRLNYGWVQLQLERVGIHADRTEISRALTGIRQGAKSAAIVAATYEALCRYEAVSGGT